MQDQDRLNADEKEQLRDALAQIAQASADQARQRGSVPTSAVEKSRGRHRRLVLATAASGVLLVGGIAGWEILGQGHTNPRTEQAAPDQHHGPAAGEEGQSLAEWIACSRTIAVGQVDGIAYPSPGRVRVSFQVEDWIRPSSGPHNITISDADPRQAGLRPPWKLGGPVLVVIPANRSWPVAAFRGDDLTTYRKWIKSALPQSTTATCPPAFTGDGK